MEKENCFLCTNRAKITPEPNRDVYFVECETCGKYYITRDATTDMTPNNPSNYILSGLIRNASSKDTILAIDSENYDELINSAIIPENP